MYQYTDMKKYIITLTWDMLLTYIGIVLNRSCITQTLPYPRVCIVLPQRIRWVAPEYVLFCLIVCLITILPQSVHYYWFFPDFALPTCLQLYFTLFIFCIALYQSQTLLYHFANANSSINPATTKYIFYNDTKCSVEFNSVSINQNNYFNS